MSHALRKVFGPIVFGFVFVVNPAYFSGCASEEEGPDFGEAEMLQVLDAANDMGRWEIESEGARYEVELVLIQATGEDAMASKQAEPMFGSPAHACSGTRTFLRSAQACDTSTHLFLEGTLTIRALDEQPVVEVVSDLEIVGSMSAYGDSLRTVQISLQPANTPYTIHLSSADARTFSLDSIDLKDVGENQGFSLEYIAEDN